MQLKQKLCTYIKKRHPKSLHASARMLMNSMVFESGRDVLYIKLTPHIQKTLIFSSQNTTWNSAIGHT